jgi:hypothetical protein
MKSRKKARRSGLVDDPATVNHGAWWQYRVLLRR